MTWNWDLALKGSREIASTCKGRNKTLNEKGHITFSSRKYLGNVKILSIFPKMRNYVFGCRCYHGPLANSYDSEISAKKAMTFSMKFFLDKPT
ncbi:hypothetical protein STEG23_005907 [Scotinomys teguina]